MTMMSSVISSVLSLSAVFVFGGEVPGRQVAILKRTLVPRHVLKFCFLCCVSPCAGEEARRKIHVQCRIRGRERDAKGDGNK